jgi:hypothetical protein
MMFNQRGKLKSFQVKRANQPRMGNSSVKGKVTEEVPLVETPTLEVKDREFPRPSPPEVSTSVTVKHGSLIIDFGSWSIRGNEGGRVMEFSREVLKEVPIIEKERFLELFMNTAMLDLKGYPGVPKGSRGDGDFMGLVEHKMVFMSKRTYDGYLRDVKFPKGKDPIFRESGIEWQIIDPQRSMFGGLIPNDGSVKYIDSSRHREVFRTKVFVLRDEDYNTLRRVRGSGFFVM